MVPEGGGEVINCTCSCCSREISYLVHIWVSFVINSFGIFRVLNGRNVAKVCYLGGNFNLCWCTSILKKINSGFFLFVFFIWGGARAGINSGQYNWQMNLDKVTIHGFNIYRSRDCPHGCIRCGISCLCCGCHIFRTNCGYLVVDLFTFRDGIDV